MGVMAVVAVLGGCKTGVYLAMYIRVCRHVPCGFLGVFGVFN